MTVAVMATSGGAHPPALWAEVTADQVIDISAQAEATKIAEARAFRSKLVVLLTDFHDRVQRHERSALAVGDGVDRLLLEEIDPFEHLNDDVVRDIVTLAASYSFAGHFKLTDTQGYLTRLLGNHFSTVKYIERSICADMHADHPSAKRFRSRHSAGV